MSAPRGSDASSPNLNFKAVLRHIVRFVSVSYLIRLLCSVRGLINARWLGPEYYGFWGGLSFLGIFGFHLHGGIQDRMIKEIPGALSRGREDEARKSAQTAFSFFSSALGLAALLIGVKAGSLPQGAPGFVRLGWWVLAISMPLEVLYLFEQNVMRSREKFGELNRSLLVASAFSLILTCWLVARCGIFGLYVTAILTPLVGLWDLRRQGGWPWSFNWDWEKMTGMLKTGFPVLGMTLIFESLGWVDRFLVLHFMGASGFGYYSLGIMVMQLCFLFPQVTASVIEPKLFYDYARESRVTDVYEHLWYPLKALAFIFPLGLAVGDFLLPKAVMVLFPAYQPAIGVMRVLLWGSFFMGLVICTRAFVVALDKQRQVLPFYGIAVLVSLGLGTAFARMGWGLTGIAAGTVCAYAVCSSQLLIFAFCHFESRYSALKRLAALYTPALAAFLVTVALPFGLTLLFPGLRPFEIQLRIVLTVLCGALFYKTLRTQIRLPQPEPAEAFV